MKANEVFRSPKILLFIPIVVYFCSYFYLAIYHQKAILINTVIHEGGLHTFLETLFYASHFLGHIPVHTVLALYFVGTYLCLDGNSIKHNSYKNRITGLILSIFFLVVLAMFLSFKWFGVEDTVAFILQKKQSVFRYEQGGSWNLHFPSTVMQFLLIPIYIFFVKLLFHSRIKVNKREFRWINLALLFFLGMTWLVNDEPLSMMAVIWSDPRYLAHSIRELATFPITYYTIPLYFFLVNENSHKNIHSESDYFRKIIIILLVLFMLLFAYQVYIPMSIGIGDLAQKPSFAVDGKLSIAYLLSSHYFEHFLESIFFILLSLILYYSSTQRKITLVEG